MVGLALEGGGAKGSYQAGAYMALKKCGIKIDAVVGTSIGAFNGALIATHEEKKMLEIWKDTTMSELLGVSDTEARNLLKGNLSLETIKKSLHEVFKVLKNDGLDISNYRALVRNSVDEEKLRKSDIKYGLTTIRAEDLKPLELYIEDIGKGKLHDYIVASSFLPVFKKEKLVDGEYYLDGGFYNLSPTDMLEKIGCDKIYVINIKGLGFRKPHLKSKAEIIEIKPTTNLGSIIVFDKISSEENITRGYNDVLRVFNKIDGVEYYFKKKSNWYYNRLNHKVDEKLFNAAKAILKSEDKKDTVIKALEYILKKHDMDDLIIYKQKDVINLAKNNKEDNIIIEYVNKLNIL